MALTAAQGVAVIGALFAQSEATRKAITDDWYFYEADRQQALGAVRMIEDTQIALERDQLDDVLNGIRSETEWQAGAQRAEEALRAIKGYSAEATINSILAATAVQTAQDVAAGAQKVAEATASVAKEAISLAWTALPPVAKIALVVLGVGATIYFVGRAMDITRAVKGATT